MEKRECGPVKMFVDDYSELRIKLSSGSSLSRESNHKKWKRDNDKKINENERPCECFMLYECLNKAIAATSRLSVFRGEAGITNPFGQIDKCQVKMCFPFAQEKLSGVCQIISKP